MIPDSPKPSSSIEAQIVDLQSKLAFQEDTVQALNEIVGEQQQDILKLQSQMGRLIEELRVVLEDLEGAEITTAIERPPHY